ncbi:MAG: phage major capsid protein, P2 family [Vibrio sp.]|uniref:phage major capsid protein, P2 family n=1 Tax=Vibrio sp. TaxID=678 RepID=UPI003F3FCA0D
MLNAISTAYLREFSTAVSTAAQAAEGAKMFNITPPMETKLRQAIMQSDAFLGMITMSLVQQIKGQAIDVGGDGLATGRGDNKRFLAGVNQSGTDYELVKTDSGAKILWEQLTQWANSGSKEEWLKLMKGSISRRFALDILRIGFNGTSVAAVTNPVANPLGEDVNKGWLTIAKEKAPAQVLASAILDPKAATAGSYKNLDSLVQDLINTTIAPEHRNDPDLVVLVGHDLVAAEQHRLLEAANVPTEHKAAQSLAKTIAGRTAHTPPFFKGTQIWVTSAKNLQVLTQEGTQWRRQVNDEDELCYKQNHIRMEGYAIGNLKKFAAIEAVTIAEDVPETAAAGDGEE